MILSLYKISGLIALISATFLIFVSFIYEPSNFWRFFGQPFSFFVLILGLMLIFVKEENINGFTKWSAILTIISFTFFAFGFFSAWRHPDVNYIAFLFMVSSPFLVFVAFIFLIIGYIKTNRKDTASNKTSF